MFMRFNVIYVFNYFVEFFIKEGKGDLNICVLFMWKNCLC